MNPHRAHRDDDSGDQPPVTLTRGKRSITALAEGHVKQETNKHKAADKDIMQVYTLSRTESQMLRLPSVSKLLKSFCRMFLNELKRSSSHLPHISPSHTSKRQRVRSYPREDDGLQGEDDTDARGATSDAETAGIDDAAEICNPLATTPSKVIEDTEGRRRFLGPSSTWAYIQQAMSILQQCVKDQPSPQLPATSDGGAFVLDWPSTSQTTPSAPLTIDRLPSLTYSLYLTDTVKFYLGPMYHLYDEDIFRERLNNFYATGPWVEPPRSSRLWFIQYLLIMALGKALILPGSSDKRPTGCDYVLRAIDLLPDVHGYYTDSILSVEILCCLSLYLQSIDHRNAAYNYIGQALRIALSQGFHRELTGASLTVKELHRHRRAWWTLYILDKRFSSLMGAPNCIQDNEITVLLPEPDYDQGDCQMFGLHVRLTRLLADVLRSRLKSTYVKDAQKTLRKTAAVGKEFRQDCDFTRMGAAPISRASATLLLYYHQCIILTTRPLFLSLIRSTLAQSGLYPKRGDVRVLAEPVKALLDTCYNSALVSLDVLVALQRQNLLEAFLPFDLDCTISAAISLALIQAIPATSHNCGPSIDAALDVLDSMIMRGYVIAQYRRAELESLLETLHTIFKHQSSTEELNHSYQDGRLRSGNASILPDMEAEQQPPNVRINRSSPDFILSLAELLDWESIMEFQGGDLEAAWL
ncbi:hypothetical protein M431DRAFT_533772 [Trichoderma harzianum CBS 226.95]|uniref:Xylanolytic transcriptional activator regulatory domain-containing protein n=1 Tax=Trichoderma harzianum CBS 226.95 TaxID=983964 RepID=A0A2T4A103_TRIHA|nr:hypothetical protein M431DRAFT_533772 [Trichoderma harzianum CBS 226.95]PTB50740.1 hypothetical protein M431DRAFT_533772 [Trichoderma harzianum CBS 226.95]